MPVALLRLLWMKTYAGLRRAVRVQGNPKKLVMLVIGVVAILMWFAPMILLNLRDTTRDTTFLDHYGPLTLACFIVVTLLASSGESAIAFQPAEVDILFPGPFTRRQLLAYKMLSGMIGSFTGAIIFSILFLPHAGSWPTALLAFVLALWLMQFLGTGAALLKQIVGELAYTRARRAALAIFLLALAALLVYTARGRTITDIPAIARAINDSVPGRILLSPFRVITNIAASPSIADALPWAAIAVGINALLALLILRLDADYTESALRASERHAERLRRARSGALFAPAPGAAVRSRHARTPRWLGAAAPIVWRQWTTLSRGGKKWLLQIASMILLAGIILYSMRRIDTPAASHWVGVGVLAYITVILAAILRFDFRADLDHIETLKALPLEPRDIALGELLLPVAVLAGVQALLIAAITFTLDWPAPMILASLLAIPVINFLVLGVENLLFLTYPTRLTNRGVADFSMMGRQMLLFLGKFIIYAIVAAIAGGAALGVKFISGSTPLALITAWIVLALAAVAIIAAAARAFRAFDVSSDMPA